MKYFLLLTISLFSSTVASAACDNRKIKDSVEKYSYDTNSGYGTRFNSIVVHGLLKAGQKMNVQVSVDDFDVFNKSENPVLVVSAYGRNQIGASFWLAKIDPVTCVVLTAGEVLGEGGAGL